MKLVSIKLITSISITLAIIMAMLPGCNSQSLPVEVQMSFSGSPTLDTPVQITANFVLKEDSNTQVAENVTARIILPEGFERIDGNLEWKGDFINGKTYTINATIKAIKTGIWKIEARADYYPNKTDHLGGSIVSYISVSENGATISDQYPQESHTYVTPSPSISPSSITTSNITEPFTVRASFPDGAPPLNKTSLLKVTVKSNYPSFKDMKIIVNLPEALELVSGELTWLGDVPAHSEVNAINATVKSVKTGNWKIEVINGWEPPVIYNGKENVGHYDIFVSISENSAEWRVYAPYGAPDASGVGTATTAKPTPLSDNGQTTRLPLDPMKISLNVSKLPQLNEPVDLICDITSQYDVPSCNVQIKLPKEASLIKGNLDWNENINAKESKSFSIQIAFTKPGHMTIEARASIKSDDGKTGGALGQFYLNMLDDHSEIGWLPDSVAAENPESKNNNLGNAKKIKLENLPNLPKPPSINLEGNLLKNENETFDQTTRNSFMKELTSLVTVTGTWKYYTELGDYRDNPTTLVPAKHFLVVLLDQNDNFLKSTYTDENGNYSATNVDSSSGIKARLYCYVNYNGDELRVTWQGNSETGLDDVYYFVTTIINYDGNIGEWHIPQGADNKGAYWIKDDMDRAYCYPHSPITSGSCTARWTKTMPNSGASGGIIQLEGVVERTPDVVIHEYAHVAMAHINPVTWNPPTHYVELVSRSLSD